MNPVIAAIGLTVLSVLSAAPAAGLSAHEQEVAAWQAGRIERLTAPDGWLSLVGLHWLVVGKTVTLGNGDDNDIDLRVGPARLGELSWEAGKARFLAAKDAGALVAGVPAALVELLPDSTGTPTIVVFGSANFQLIERGDQFALRVKDAQAPTRTRFAGINMFPVDASWRIEARFEAYPQPRTIEVATVTGTLEAYPNPGRIAFERDGATHYLEALVEEGTEQFFLILADRTSGKETYGMARYLYAGPPVDGKIVVDFNRAYNPPCAFTAFATCPMPPPGNRLNLSVRAGEKTYRAQVH